MNDEKSLLEIDTDEFLKQKVKYLKNKVRELHAEIRRTEELLRAYDQDKIKDIKHNAPNQLPIASLDVKQLDFSLTYWKPQVLGYLLENPSAYTTDQILIGIDRNKTYSSDKDLRAKAIKAISSSLFHLNKESKVVKQENPGRRGWKWALNVPDLG